MFVLAPAGVVYAAVPPVSFSPAANYPAGGSPVSVAVGDFDKDGRTDLAVTNGSARSVSVLLGKGDGTFGPAVGYSIDSGAFSVAVGDFDDDGNPDLVVTKVNADSVSVLLGKGDGTFDPAVGYPAGSRPASVAVGDFNKDGKTDLTTANSDGDAPSVSVLLGNGDGTFDSPVNYPAGTLPVSVAVGDFNKDGNPDLTIANDGIGIKTVSVLLGNGDGTFDPAVNYPAGDSPRSVAVGDFNHDGNPDLTAADVSANRVSVLLGNGDGTFGSAVSYPSGDTPVSVAVGDFNHDGNPDLTTANNNAGSVSVLLNRSAALTIAKVAQEDGFTGAGETLHYTFTVTNRGTVPLVNLMVTDSTPGVQVWGCGTDQLASDESTTCQASYTTTRADVAAGTVTDQGTASATASDGSKFTATSNTVTVPFAGMSVVKAALETGYSAAGQTLNYTYTVTNTGKQTISGLTVTDHGPGTPVVTCPPTTLAPGVSTVCTAAYTTTAADVKAGKVSNTATTTGATPGGTTVTAESNTVTVLACAPCEDHDHGGCNGSHPEGHTGHRTTSHNNGHRPLQQRHQRR
ncbi:FG-GAP-like repeat-containing protein [Streptomyces sp. NPDC059168]|uniref:FG-GAP-like repeat-containing protein n=1 Tax=Streptomyces sp. NPDC059168 TaxID=3346753 RepID=UPI0036A66F28